MSSNELLKGVTNVFQESSYFEVNDFYFFLDFLGFQCVSIELITFD